MTRPALNAATLPTDPIARREVLEERARPDPQKPTLSPEREARLAAIEEKSARCYVEAEEITFRLTRAADRINNYVPRSTRLPSEAGRPGTDPGKSRR